MGKQAGNSSKGDSKRLCIVFTGIAGGIAEETQVLDVVIGDRLVESDYGVFHSSGFEWASGDAGVETTPGEYYYSDPRLADFAYEAAVQALGEEHVFKGTIAT